MMKNKYLMFLPLLSFVLTGCFSQQNTISVGNNEPVSINEITHYFNNKLQNVPNNSKHNKGYKISYNLQSESKCDDFVETGKYKIDIWVNKGKAIANFDYEVNHRDCYRNGFKYWRDNRKLFLDFSNYEHFAGVEFNDFYKQQYANDRYPSTVQTNNQLIYSTNPFIEGNDFDYISEISRILNMDYNHFSYYPMELLLGFIDYVGLPFVDDTCLTYVKRTPEKEEYLIEYSNYYYDWDKEEYAFIDMTYMDDVLKQFDYNYSSKYYSYYSYMQNMTAKTSVTDFAEDISYDFDKTNALELISIDMLLKSVIRDRYSSNI